MRESRRYASGCCVPHFNAGSIDEKKNPTVSLCWGEFGVGEMRWESSTETLPVQELHGPGGLMVLVGQSWWACPRDQANGKLCISSLLMGANGAMVSGMRALKSSRSIWVLFLVYIIKNDTQMSVESKMSAALNWLFLATSKGWELGCDLVRGKGKGKNRGKERGGMGLHSRAVLGCSAYPAKENELWKAAHTHSKWFNKGKLSTSIASSEGFFLEIISDSANEYFSLHLILCLILWGRSSTKGS